MQDVPLDRSSFIASVIAGLDDPQFARVVTLRSMCHSMTTDHRADAMRALRQLFADVLEEDEESVRRAYA